jgi:hypothetical protein
MTFPVTFAVFARSHYSGAEVAWYIGGFLAWTPAYVMVIWIGLRQRRLEIPVIAATGNIAWEFVWGWFFHVDMGYGLQNIYRGAFLIDAVILYFVFKYGRDQTAAPLARRWHPVFVVALLVGWGWLVVAMHHTTNVDLPLGSTSAYLINLAESGIYVWFGMTVLAADSMSLVVAWSKGLGTAMVTVFVFLQYPDHAFVKTLAVIVGIIDAAYVALMYARRRGIVNAQLG